MSEFFGIIPARAGSTRIKNKNMQLLDGKPLIQHTFEAALNSNNINYTIVSTDDQNIISLALKMGINAPFVRPDSLAQENSLVIDAVNHALKWYQKEFSLLPKYFILLAPTSPFRTSIDIDNAVQKILDNDKDSLVSVCPVTQHPAECVNISNNGKIEFIEIDGVDLRQGTQNYKEYFFIDASICICKTSAFFDHYLKLGILYDKDSDPFIMEKSHCIDINDMYDLKQARAMSKQSEIINE
jgi:CMP-N,N'-diacetyllegionaminic acid synthase